MNFLETILEEKKREIAEAQENVPLDRLVSEARACPRPESFKAALQKAPFALIAEIKRASPSKGTLVNEFDHRQLAKEFQAGGAHALSVLTDRKHFGGDPSFIREVKEVVNLPVLRKDFIVDEYQIYESLCLHADAILLIVKALSAENLRRLHHCALSLGLEVLVETHTRREIETANEIGAEIIGINNRDLSTFIVNIETSLQLGRFIRSDALAVSESGIHSPSDVLMLRDSGFKAVLVGESLVTHTNRIAAVRELLP
jgi:indole-3-glycerol phosphate synthase